MHLPQITKYEDYHKNSKSERDYQSPNQLVPEISIAFTMNLKLQKT